MNYYGQKIKTEIPGLDKLLFGGLHLQDPSSISNTIRPLFVAIYGDKGTSKALLAMQMLHGITKSVKQYNFFGNKKYNPTPFAIVEPVFCSSERNDNVSDMLIDMLLSKCVNLIVEDNASGKDNWKASEFASTMFETKIDSNSIPIDKSKLDMYIGEEMLVYNSHTNALHLAMPQDQRERNETEQEEDAPIFCRKHDSIEKYAEEIHKSCVGSSDLWNNIFNIRIYSAIDGNIGELIEWEHNLTEYAIIPCLVIDKNLSTNENANNELFARLRRRSLVTVYIYEENLKTDMNMQFDLHIELRRKEDEATHYLFNQLSITKSTLQDTAIGWHIFKKRDYGIEVYPSSHVLLQKRRHMPKDVLFSQKPILAQTFQHFIEEKQESNKARNIQEYENFLTDSKYLENELSKLLTNRDRQKERECPIDVLKDILMPPESKTGGSVTALIGSPNTYKRYLTHSSTFSASCKGKHTLNVLLDKDEQIMNRKMLCPAHKGSLEHSNIEKMPLCVKCYKNVHLSNIRMGCISSDEFFFYLIKQIELSRKHAPISRIVIDDIQKIEFCFPILHNDGLFLTTLISICKDYQIDLFMLCDKKSKLVNALRAQADNVICTERTEPKALNIYVERYAESATHSRLWKCRVEHPLQLFNCDIVGTHRNFHMNERNITNEDIYSMEDYWSSYE